MANYSLRVDGTANKAASEDGDKTLISECMNVVTHNAASFADGDRLYFWSNGGAYRGVPIRPPSDGSSGNNIEYIFDANVELNGAYLFDESGDWSVYSGNIWEVETTYSIDDVHYDETQGILQANRDAPNAEGEWYWAEGSPRKLYLYSASNPATLYTSPGLEGSDRDRCIESEKSYLTFSGNGCDVRYSIDDGIFNRGNTDDRNYSVIIQDFTVHDIDYDNGKGGHGMGIRSINCQDLIVRRCECYRISWDAFQIMVWALTGEATFTNNLHEDCYVHECQHSSFDSQGTAGKTRMTGTTFRRCRVENSNGGFYHTNTNSGANGNRDSSFEYCIVDGATYEGMKIIQSDNGEYHPNLVVVGCIITGAGQYDGGAPNGEGLVISATNGTIKNNVIFNNQVNTYGNNEFRIWDGGGTPNDVDYNLVWNTSLTDLYEENGGDYTHAEYQSFGQQIHGLNEDPKFVDPGNGNFELQTGSPCIGTGANLGSSYDQGIMPGSTWPDNVITGDQDDY
jgi:hypothetical protein